MFFVGGLLVRVVGTPLIPVIPSTKNTPGEGSGPRDHSCAPFEDTRAAGECAAANGAVFNLPSLAVIAIALPEGHVVKANARALALLGYGAGEIAGVLLSALTLAEDRQGGGTVARLLAGEQIAAPSEKRFVRRDGSLFWGRLHLALAPDGSGGVRSAIAVIEEIAQRREAEAHVVSTERKLAAAEIEYRALFENMNEGVSHCRMIFEAGEPVDFEFIEVNRRFGELTGLHQVIGKKFSDVVPEIRVRDPEIFKVYGGVVQAGQPRKLERYNPAMRQWFNLSIYPTGANCFVTVFDVITERKLAEGALQKSEAQLKAIFNGINDAAIFTDQDRRIRMVNPAFTRMFGYSAPEVAGTLASLIYADPMDYSRQGERVYHRGVTDGYDLRELRYRRKDGTEFWAESLGSPIFDGHGQLIGYLGVHRDITARQQLEKQFLHAQRLEAIGALASGIAHDLNNILTPLLVATGFLEDKIKDAGDKEMLKIIGISARRGAGIIRQLLTFGRGVEGQRQLLAVGHLAKEMAEIVRETFPRNLTIVERVPAGLWAVRADATQVHQVLMNLCVNARDAMPRGGVLSIAAENISLNAGDLRLPAAVTPGPFVRVDVRDTGAGIPAEIVGRIFDPFFTTKEVGKGSGLGLPSVLAIVRSHGGFVLVASAPGQGATFSVYLPAEPAAEAEASSAPDCIPRGSGETLLVVDDEAPVLQTVQLLLERLGYRVLTAVNGQEALAIFLTHRTEIRLVITDTMMPVMDGIELARSLHELDPNVRIITSSGLGQPEYAAPGVREFLRKPYEVSALLAAVRRQLPQAAPPASETPRA